MKFEELLRELRIFYPPDEWREYLTYFDTPRTAQTDGESGSSSKGAGSTVLGRILGVKGAPPETPELGASEKLVAPGRLQSLAEREGLSLGVVSGCYDLLHLGHLRGIGQASQYLAGLARPHLCAFVLSDEHIKAKKGEVRPILSLSERLELLIRVKCLDYILVLNEPNCLAALEQTRPHYFFKSRNDVCQPVVNAEMALVESLGGKTVFFADDPAGAYSTTGLIEAALKRAGRDACHGL